MTKKTKPKARQASRGQISKILERVSEVYDRMIEENPESFPSEIFVPMKE